MYRRVKWSIKLQLRIQAVQLLDYFQFYYSFTRDFGNHDSFLIRLHHYKYWKVQFVIYTSFRYRFSKHITFRASNWNTIPRNNTVFESEITSRHRHAVIRLSISKKEIKITTIHSCRGKIWKINCNFMLDGRY